MKEEERKKWNEEIEEKEKALDKLRQKIYLIEKLGAADKETLRSFGKNI